jgi:hypothetical protein
MGPASPATLGGAPQIRRICIASGVRNLPPAGLATSRESSNVCVIGAVGFPPQRRTTHMGFETDLIAETDAEVQS